MGNYEPYLIRMATRRWVSFVVVQQQVTEVKFDRQVAEITARTAELGRIY